jgi:hypothetical protein
MYRELASVGRVFGTRSGPYTGGAQRVDLRALPAATLARLRRALSGEGLPGVLALTRTKPANRMLGVHLLFTLVATLILFGAQMYFNHLRLFWLLPFVLCGAAWGATTVASLRHWRGSQLPGGRYLFPFDLVEIRGRELLIRPLGGLRKVGIKQSFSGATLGLTFEDGTCVDFALANAAEADRIYQLLEQAHELLEQLTLNPNLDIAAANDLFFDLRDEQTWSAALPRLRPTQSLLGMQRATALAVGIGMAVGAGILPMRNRASDELEFTKAKNANTEDAYRRYQQSSVLGRHSADAEDRIQLLRDLHSASEAQQKYFNELEKEFRAPKP